MRFSTAPTRAIVGYVVTLVLVAGFTVAMAVLAHQHAEYWAIAAAGGGVFLTAVRALLFQPAILGQPSPTPSPPPLPLPRLGEDDHTGNTPTGH